MTTAPVALLAAAPAPCPIQLRDVTPQTRITFRHTDGSSGRRYIVETVTAGLATFDYDGDGLIDIYFVNGAPLPGTKTDVPPKDALYRNNGDWTFSDVTEQAGVGEMGFGLGVAAADYDEDGDQDLYVSNFGPKVLYRNNGDGTFTDVTRQAGVADGEKVGAGACFLDGDADGDLDLFVANYVQFTFANHVEVVVDGHPQYAGPKEYEPEQSTYFRNNGDGTFTDASRASGIADHPGTGMGIVALDYDNDADTDIAVLNDVAGNYLFANDGRGRFEEVGLLTGFAYNLDGNEMGSMGVDCGDYDNDGWLDLFQTAYSGELPALFRNTGDGAFDDVTRSTGAGVGAFPYVNWGTGFADFDSDGYRDLFIANGHLQDNVHLYDGTTAYEVCNQVLRNTGRGKFVDISGQCGDGLLPKLSSRGAAIDDLDNDGDLDIVVLNSRRESTVIRNESPRAGHWLAVLLRGTRTNRDGVGARVTVVAGDLTLADEVHSGRGYQGHFGTRLHFGLGPHTRIDRIEVRWIGGQTDVWKDIAVDRLITLTERP
ncbi:MAG: VCBS repeat-containing protein [Thermoguttaceae bacterium]|nr:VCBS repeat-containing protein [Thermoguttaceae bacterium]